MNENTRNNIQNVLLYQVCEFLPELRREERTDLMPSSSSIHMSFLRLSLRFPRPVLAVEAGEVWSCASSRNSSGHLRKNMRTLTGVATSTAAILSSDSSWPMGAGRRRLGPNRVAKLLRFILFSSELAAILVCVGGGSRNTKKFTHLHK